MCARFTSTRENDEFAHYFEIPVMPDRRPRYNIAPAQIVPVIVAHAAARELVAMRWGLVPDLSQQPAGYVNARLETVLEKPAFRDAVRSRRCLVPCDGFIEWESAAGAKHPHWFRMADQSQFAIAGIWQPANPASNRHESTFAILTVPANPDLARLHDRMPAILSRSASARWLDSTMEPRAVLSLLGPLSAGSLVSCPVSPKLNSPRFDSPELLKATPVGLFDEV